MSRISRYHHFCCFAIAMIFTYTAQAQSHQSSTDSIVVAAIVYNGDTIPALTLQDAVITLTYTREQAKRLDAWTKLRNAVYVTYPYAKRAGAVINQINSDMANMKDESQRKAYL